VGDWLSPPPPPCLPLCLLLLLLPDTAQSGSRPTQGWRGAGKRTPVRATALTWHAPPPPPNNLFNR
jgi:hypothetical protein